LSKGLAILSSKPEVQGQFGKRRNFSDKRRKIPEKAEIAGKKAGNLEKAEKLE
jgi:hypothetical protein